MKQIAVQWFASTYIRSKKLYTKQNAGSDRNLGNSGSRVGTYEYTTLTLRFYDIQIIIFAQTAVNAVVGASLKVQHPHSD